MSDDDKPIEAAWQTALKAKGFTKAKSWFCSSCGTENLVRDPRCKLCSEPKPLQTDAAATTKVRKWEIKEDKPFQFDFNSKPHPDIEHIVWSEVEGVMKSPGGSGGVYFIATPAGGLVLKCSMTLFSEVFGAALGQCAGLKTSKCRILTMASSEGDEMYDKLCEVDEKHHGNGIIRSDLQVKHVLLYSYVPGVSFDVNEEALERMLGPSGKLSEIGLQRLRAVGKLMAFDMLCHNTDRLPLVSDNTGNKGNLLMSTVPGSADIVLIDSAVACIDPTKHTDTLGRYLDVCSVFLKKLYANPSKPTLNVLRVRDSIMETTSFDIDAAPLPSDEGWRARMAQMSAAEKRAAAQAAPGSQEIQKGILDFLEEAKINIDVVRNIKGSIMPADLVGCEMVREDYFVVMLKLLEKKGDMAGLSGAQFIKDVLSSGP